MTTLKLKVNLMFDEPLLFEGFLPEKEGDFLRLSVYDGKYNIAVYISDRKTQLSPFDFVPTNPEQLTASTNSINCRGLTLEIDVLKPEPDVVSVLKAEQITETLTKFVDDVYDMVLKVYNGIVEYFRNVEKQYWLRPIRYNTYSHVNFLVNADILWSDTEDDWRKFPKPKRLPEPALESTISGPDTTLNRKTHIDRVMWVDKAPKFLEQFITRGRSAKSIDVLIANAYWHLEQQNTSLAVIEAVRALEQFVKNRLPQVISTFTKDNQMEVDEREVDKLFKKAGLTAITLIVFGLLGKGIGLSSDDIAYIQKAVELRNEIMHSAREKVEFCEANKCVSAIHRATTLMNK